MTIEIQKNLEYVPLRTSESSISSPSSSSVDIVAPSSSELTLSSRLSLFLSRLRFIFWKYRCHILLSTIVSVFVFVVWVLFANTYDSLRTYDQIFKHPTHDAWGRKIHRVGFEGDSLCPHEENVKDVIQHLQRNRPDMVWSAITDCFPGSLLNVDFPDCDSCREWALKAGRHDIVSRMESGLLKYKVDAIVLLWDSDAVDVPLPYGVNKTVPYEERMRRYSVDLNAVLKAFKAVTDKILVMGPVLYGEAPNHQNPRDDILNAFLRTTRDECKRNNVSYYDLRSEFLSNIPSSFSDWRYGELKSGYWTIDGEHFSGRGMNRVVEIYKSYLEKWFPSNSEHEFEYEHDNGDFTARLRT